MELAKYNPNQSIPQGGFEYHIKHNRIFEPESEPYTFAYEPGDAIETQPPTGQAVIHPGLQSDPERIGTLSLGAGLELPVVASITVPNASGKNLDFLIADTRGLEPQFAELNKRAIRFGPLEFRPLQDVGRLGNRTYTSSYMVVDAGMIKKRSKDTYAPSDNQFTAVSMDPDNPTVINPEASSRVTFGRMVSYANKPEISVVVDDNGLLVVRGANGQPPFVVRTSEGLVSEGYAPSFKRVAGRGKQDPMGLFGDTGIFGGVLNAGSRENFEAPINPSYKYVDNLIKAQLAEDGVTDVQAYRRVAKMVLLPAPDGTHPPNVDLDAAARYLTTTYGDEKKITRPV